MTDLLERLQRVKHQCIFLKNLSAQKREQVLLSLASLIKQSNKTILTENAKDLQAMPKTDPKYDRLELTEKRILSIAEDVQRVAQLPNPCEQIMQEQTMTNGLRIQKISVPLGLIGVIFESRPNVIVDVFTLCFKAGNACALKGGKEAQHTNLYLMSLIQQTLKQHDISIDSVLLLPNDREAMHTLLNAVNVVDVCIPRGGQELIRYVREHAKVPVIETGAGIVHAYFDASGQVDMGRQIINNAKTRRVSVCNALDTLLIHQDALGQLPDLVEPLIAHKVALYADKDSYQALQGKYPQNLLNQAKTEDFGIEYLDYKMSIKTVSSVTKAIEHIQLHTSAHSEAIIAEDAEVIEQFLQQIDAAVLYVNASTAFTDGGEFGMGAEIGISTQKLHARGPMALQALTSYQWRVYGTGQVRQ